MDGTITTSALPTDNAGLSATTADTTNVSVDNLAPTLTDGSLGIGSAGVGGAYVTGDTVTATWDDTSGDSNSDTISGVTVDFSGLAAVARSAGGSGTWTASYTRRRKP